jgi:prolyl-tRNA editing enzyme YbaK/EbsC (Cys-tRNA(Pro) deacylase)
VKATASQLPTVIVARPPLPTVTVGPVQVPFARRTPCGQASMNSLAMTLFGSLVVQGRVVPLGVVVLHEHELLAARQQAGVATEDLEVADVPVVGRQTGAVAAPGILGTLATRPALDAPDLVAAPVLAALRGWSHASDVAVAPIDAALADTAAFVGAYDVPPDASANCVVVAGRRDGEERVAACVVLATTRADVNGVVRRLLDVRKASFLPTDRAVAETGMEYGGITPLGLPARWRLLVDERVAALPAAVVGSGVRHSKLVLPGVALAAIPGAEVVPGLAI